MTVAWHVDNLKISYMDPNIVSSFIDDLDKKYGVDARRNKTPLTVKREKVHEYLGMVLDFSKPRKVIIDMKEYILKILNDLLEEFNGTSITPAAEHLFKVNPNGEKLNAEESVFSTMLWLNFCSYVREEDLTRRRRFCSLPLG